MTDSQATEAMPQGILAALMGVLRALKPSLPSKDAVWTMGLWLAVTGTSALGGALGWHWVAPVKQVKDVAAIEAAVAETKQAESVKASERVAFIAENRDLGDLADKCAAAVKDAIKSGKKTK